MILATQNLYGILKSDGATVVETTPINALCNGIATDGRNIYIGDWNSIIRICDHNCQPERIPIMGADNIHTVNIFHDQLLIASTTNDSVILGDEVIYRSRDFGYDRFTYVNAAIPYTDDTILIGLRNPKHVLFFSVPDRKVIRRLSLPFLRNMHHPTPYMDNFLVSDGDGVVMFDESGKPILKSPSMSWPRGIKVQSRTKVWVVDRDGIILWNPVTNRINNRIDSPIPKPTTTADEMGGALFDLVIL